MVALCVCLIASCKEKEIYPSVPSIEFKGYYFLKGGDGKDSLVTLIFSFKDGDGDIGLGENDTLPPFNRQIDTLGKNLNRYYYNLYIDYLEKREGKFEYVLNPAPLNDSLRFAFRVQNLTPDGRHKAIRGDLLVNVPSSPWPGAGDTTRYKLVLIDRAKHESNQIESPPIIWSR